jgi:hypothetical protein
LFLRTTFPTLLYHEGSADTPHTSVTTVAKLLGPGGARAVVADSLLMKQQLLVIHRSRRRAPNLSTPDRFLFGFWSLFLNPHRIQLAAVIVRPSTLFKFHNLLKGSRHFNHLQKWFIVSTVCFVMQLDI